MERNKEWEEAIILLKSIIASTKLLPEIKWGTEVYTLNGKNVLGAVAFKNHFTLWFYNGVFLSDPYKVLVNAQEGKTKALRQWRFSSIDEIDEKKVLRYIHEAIKNEESGKVWKPEKQPAPTLPAILAEKLNSNKKLKAAFEKLAPYKQKDYIEHIQSAKQDKTKVSRLEKVIPMILQGTGLNDQYK